MVEQQEQAAGAQHPAHLDDRGAFVGHAAQRQGAHRGVERGVAEGQMLSLSLGLARRSTVRPRSEARLAAAASMAGLRSTPVSRMPSG